MPKSWRIHPAPAAGVGHYWAQISIRGFVIGTPADFESGGCAVWSQAVVNASIGELESPTTRAAAGHPSSSNFGRAGRRPGAKPWEAATATIGANFARAFAAFFSFGAITEVPRCNPLAFRGSPR